MWVELRHAAVGGRKTFRLSNETEKGELWIARLTKFLSISRGPPSTTLTRGTAPGHARDTVLHSDVCCQADVGLIISPPPTLVSPGSRRTLSICGRRSPRSIPRSSLRARRRSSRTTAASSQVRGSGKTRTVLQIKKGSFGRDPPPRYCLEPNAAAG